MMIAGCTSWKMCHGCGRIVQRDCCEVASVSSRPQMSTTEGIRFGKAKLMSMRATGLSWRQMSQIFDMDRTALRRFAEGDPKEVSHKMQWKLGIKVIHQFLDWGETSCEMCGAKFIRRAKYACTCSEFCRNRRRSWGRSGSTKTAAEWMSYCDARLSSRGGKKR